MDQLIYDHLIEKGLLGEQDEIPKAYIKFGDKNQVIISGNRSGLVMLADYVVEVALCDSLGAHRHLDEINFFENDDGYNELIIEKYCKNE